MPDKHSRPGKYPPRRRAGAKRYLRGIPPDPFSSRGTGLRAPDDLNMGGVYYVAQRRQGYDRG